MERRLAAARVAGSWAVATVGQFAVDMPGGYFGPRDQLTPWGVLFVSALAVAAVFVITGVLQRRRWSTVAVPLFFSTSAGVFLVPAASDPLIAGLVVVWNLALLVQHFTPGLAAPPGRGVAQEDLDRWLLRSGPAVRHLALTALVLTVAVVGYRLTGSALALSTCGLLHAAALVLSAGFVRRLLVQRHRPVLLLLLLVVAALLSVASPLRLLTLLALAQAVLVLLLMLRYRGAGEVLATFYRRPSHLLFASFTLVILLGTVVLTFPAASASGRPLAALDALFTATSATCVTGLIVLDTPVDFSPLGHGVILGLIQVGGLGILVLSTFATLLLGGSLGLRGEQALRETFELTSGHAAYRLTRFIVLSTLAVEAVGAAILAARFATAGYSWPEAWWAGVFHSVSAFCNAGFALQSDSLVMFHDDPWALSTVAVLITVGGLGFAVLAGLWGRLVLRRRGRLTLQVKTVLAASAVLLLVGTGFYLALEWDRSLAGLTPLEKLGNALFQSVTLRTAGFNSVSFDQLATASALVMMVLMFVGASPGSTGGGIKTTTAAVLLSGIAAVLQGSRRVTLFDRELSPEVLLRSLAIAVIAVATVLGGLFLLLLVEDQPPLPLAFEVVSAAGTVGLSLGVTPHLSAAGKLAIIAVMFIGRIGPLTLAVVLGTRETRQDRIRRPEGRVMVG
jgi:trk system potassium uptake protein TrkH